jgi:hypothetical protein
MSFDNVYTAVSLKMSNSLDDIASSNRAKNGAESEHDQKKHKQYLRDSRSAGCDPAEPKNTCNERKNKKR